DVRLSRAGDLLAALRAGELEREPDDLFAALAGNQFETFRHPGSLHILDARIQILDVLADDDQIDAAAAVGRLHSRQFADGANVRVRLEQLPERNVRRFLAVADRGTERPFEDHARLADALDRLLRHAGRDPLFEN